MADRSQVRPAAVAGLFYPAVPAVLRSRVEEHLRAAAVPPGAPAKAVIAPHAGYVYSGPIAGSAFAALARRPVRRVVLIGPSHRVAFRGIALPGAAGFETPLGSVRVDAEAVEALEALPAVHALPAAHAEEHSLEVEIPFLQVLFDDFSIVPLVVGEAGPDAVAEVLERTWGGEETAVVVSSDLSHYLPAERAEEVDRATAGQIVALGGPLAADRACGARPIDGLLEVARRRRLEASLLDLRHSGDTAGDRSRVVGYGAFAFAEGAP
jgi:AmmeMemoRadiSam system protein B